MNCVGVVSVLWGGLLGWVGKGGIVLARLWTSTSRAASGWPGDKAFIRLGWSVFVQWGSFVTRCLGILFFSLFTSPLLELFFMVFTDPPGIKDHEGLEWSLAQRFYELELLSE